MLYKYILMLLFVVSSAAATAGVGASGQDDKPTARSLFSTGYGVTFDAETPSGSVSEVDAEVQSLNADRNGDPLSERGESSTEIEEASVVPELADTETVREPDDRNEKIASQPDIPGTHAAVSYAGLSYKLFKQGPDRQFQLSNPDQIFRSGDRVFLEVTSNIAGTLVTGNIDSNYDATLLSIDDVEPGRITRVPAKGALKFVGVKGTEKLVFVLTENVEAQLNEDSAKKFVKQCQSGSRTRSLVVDDDAGNQFQVLESDGSCAAKSVGGRTRSIIVDVEEDTGYGVIEDEALKSGKLLSLIINLEHQ